MRRYMRSCDNCTHFTNKDWGVWRCECSQGHDTPDGTYTEACSDYSEQYTIGVETKYCDDCIHYDQWKLGTSCKNEYEIPDSKHVCEEFESGESEGYAEPEHDFNDNNTFLSHSDTQESTSEYADGTGGGGGADGIVGIIALVLFLMLLGYFNDVFHDTYIEFGISTKHSKQDDIRYAAELEYGYKLLDCADGAGFGLIWSWCSDRIHTPGYFEKKFSNKSTQYILNKIKIRKEEIRVLIPELDRQCKNRTTVGTAYYNCVVFNKFRDYLVKSTTYPPSIREKKAAIDAKRRRELLEKTRLREERLSRIKKRSKKSNVVLGQYISRGVPFPRSGWHHKKLPVTLTDTNIQFNELRMSWGNGESKNIWFGLIDGITKESEEMRVWKGIDAKFDPIRNSMTLPQLNRVTVFYPYIAIRTTNKKSFNIYFVNDSKRNQLFNDLSNALSGWRSKYTELVSGIKHSPTVYAIQQRLKILGYNAGPIDGVYGRKTRNAILSFQRDRGLIQNGIASNELLSQLKIK